MQIGAQIVTVRHYAQTLEDFEVTLKKVSDIGYKSIQVSGTCAFEPEWLKDKLDKYGLKCVLTHTSPHSIVNATEQTVRNHAVFDCKNIGLGAMPIELWRSLDGYNQFKKIYVPVAEKIRDMGAKLHYHNHGFEFEKLEDKNVIERMLEDFPENSIDFTLDLGWAAHANADVLEVIKMLDGRLSRIHLKDIGDMPDDGSITTEAYFRPIYEGKLDYDAYIKALAAAGTEYMLVEQDECYGEDPFECLRRSYENVTSRFPDVK